MQLILETARKFRNPESLHLTLVCLQLAQQGIAQGHIAYQGAPGGFSEELASSLSPGLQPLPCQQYEDVFLALTGFAAEKALVPIENSLGGSIHEILDLLLR